ncbi:hypothetical protein P692DRAFT_20447207 [Suillus brevipes Sb2]|nr:hypothetical protein P692DRAFT_20447207 [Suillus brevipes Sb2]
MAKNPDCLGVLLKLGVDLYKLSFIKSRIYFPFTRLYDTNYAPMAWAAATRNEVVVDFLLLHTNGNLPDDILHVAVRVDYPSHESIRKFRQRGADVNFTVHGSTPIHYFLSFYYHAFFDEYRTPSLPVVKALVEPSCNLSLQDTTARTALHIALDEHMEDIVVYLLEKKRRAVGNSDSPSRHVELGYK